MRPPVLMDVEPGAVLAALRATGARRLVHGHTHRPAVHRLNLDGQSAERIVLAGFSQGCAITLGAGLRCSRRLAGLVGMSGYLPLANTLAAERKPTKRSPAAPFMTSTLQQEAGRKLRFSAQRTMSAAQRLYEGGHITLICLDDPKVIVQGAVHDDELKRA